MPPWDRLRARRRRDDDETSPDEETETVHVVGDEGHAWWAEREDLERGYVAPPKPPPPAEEPPAKSAFEEYFSAESLFSSDAHREDAEIVMTYQAPDPYIVLGVAETATWEEISAAHRKLAKLHHPDRLLSATPDDRERSERRMRELNIAYSELRRRRGR